MMAPDKRALVHVPQAVLLFFYVSTNLYKYGITFISQSVNIMNVIIYMTEYNILQIYRRCQHALAEIQYDN